MNEIALVYFARFAVKAVVVGVVPLRATTVTQSPNWTVAFAGAGLIPTGYARFDESEAMVDDR
ncbi:MAG: hypothetical protein ABEJ59_04470 [Halanaeroarchaeum sp.]